MLTSVLNIEHTRYWSVFNDLVNVLAGLIRYWSSTARHMLLHLLKNVYGHNSH